MSKHGEKETTQARFLRELRHHFKGWMTKITTDLSQAAFDKEVADLKSDPVYSAFGFDSPEYALVRIMGRVSISIGRRLGEIYDKMPRFISQARFGLVPEDVAPKIDGRLQLDVCIPFAKMKEEDRAHAKQILAKRLTPTLDARGIAIEIRYNFNPNDSSRLRKDEEMAALLEREKLVPVYLVFSTISPREEAIKRLRRAGWTFLIGNDAKDFMNDLIGMNIEEITGNEIVRAEIAMEIKAIMSALYSADVVKSTIKPYVGSSKSTS